MKRSMLQPFTLIGLGQHLIKESSNVCDIILHLLSVVQHDGEVHYHTRVGGVLRHSRNYYWGVRWAWNTCTKCDVIDY